MALDECICRPLQRGTVEWARQGEHQLHRVDIRRARIIQRMEEQPLLQRRQWQYVFQLRVLAFQALDLGLRECQ